MEINDKNWDTPLTITYMRISIVHRLVLLVKLERDICGSGNAENGSTSFTENDIEQAKVGIFGNWIHFDVIKENTNMAINITCITTSIHNEIIFNNYAAMYHFDEGQFSIRKDTKTVVSHEKRIQFQPTREYENHSASLIFKISFINVTILNFEELIRQTTKIPLFEITSTTKAIISGTERLKTSVAPMHVKPTNLILIILSSLAIGISLIVLILLVVMFLKCKPDRRRRVFSRKFIL
ncbi:hypothetical protein RF11_14359 [Thelohanellus kitauei]|uniref:Uncharacterized protein n=1 Tax=Thelohanellus kitauei TaxID=669202 RepID=A0A0C2JWV8_THEKT|nr:hypothetical protein RF11_14359 [Thelohanellus kitauei]